MLFRAELYLKPRGLNGEGKGWAEGWAVKPKVL